MHIFHYYRTSSWTSYWFFCFVFILLIFKVQDVGAEKDTITFRRASTHYGKPNWDHLFLPIINTDVDRLESHIIQLYFSAKMTLLTSRSPPFHCCHPEIAFVCDTGMLSHIPMLHTNTDLLEQNQRHWNSICMWHWNTIPYTNGTYKSGTKLKTYLKLSSLSILVVGFFDLNRVTDSPVIISAAALNS